MATKEQMEEMISQIYEKIDTISSYQIEDLVREEQLGSQLSFADARPIILDTIELFNRTKSLNLEGIPLSMLASFSSQIDAAISRFESFKSFDPNQGNPVNQRNSLIKQLEREYDNYYKNSLPILTAGILKGNDLSFQQAKIEQLVSQFEGKISEVQQKGQEYLTKLEDTLTSAQAAAVEAGVSKHSQIFKQESTEHEKKSVLWLRWTVALLVLIVIASVIFIKLFLSEDYQNIEIIQFSISKIIILSALFYGLSICNRNYKAHKHNATLNKHRQNALSTFETFAGAAGTDAQTKNAVLIEATHTIFSNQLTGYLSSEKDNESSNRIVEIIKSVTDNRS